MRVNLLTKSSGLEYQSSQILPLSMTIRPSCGIPGDYVYATNSVEVLRLLRRSTTLPSAVLRRFEGDLHTSTSAKLLGVELDEKTLTDIGYFID